MFGKQGVLIASTGWREGSPHHPSWRSTAHRERLVVRRSPGRCRVLKLQGWQGRWQPLQVPPLVPSPAMPSITQRLPRASLLCGRPPQPGEAWLPPLTREQPVETGLRDKHRAALHAARPPPRTLPLSQGTGCRLRATLSPLSQEAPLLPASGHAQT